MAVKDFDYFFAQLRRIEDHREEKAEKQIRKMYKGILKELQQFVAEEYVSLAEDGKLTYEILRSKGQDARFLQEVEDRLSGLSLDVQKEIRKTVKEVYQLAFDGLRDAVNKAKDTAELREILQGMDSQTAQTMWATVDNTIMDVALDKNHRENIWNIKREVATALREGDRFETMARRIEKALGYTHRKAILITRTEVHRVREAGHLAQAQVLNEDLRKGNSRFRMVKQWMTMKDERVRPNYWYKTKKGLKKGKRRTGANHVKMHGVIVEEDELFDLGNGVKTTAPGQSGDAGNDCNCRCTVLHLHMDDAEFFKATGRHFKDWEPEPEQEQIEIKFQ